MNGYWFKSSLFEVDPREDEETNPRRYGRQLAHWLRPRLEQRGYAVADVFAEDWGWCVMCQSNPFSLWVGCGNMEDFQAKPEDPPPSGESVIWHCFPAAKVPLLARAFGRVDAAPALERLDADLGEILASDPSITFVSEP